VKRQGREVEIVVNGNFNAVLDRIKTLAPEDITVEGLTLEEIFVATLK
jgi:hypothetical protein